MLGVLAVFILVQMVIQLGRVQNLLLVRDIITVLIMEITMVF